MLSRVYLGWGILVCLGLMTAEVRGWQTPTLFGPTASNLNSGPGGHSTGFGAPYHGIGGSPSRGSGGSWGWGGGK